MGETDIVLEILPDENLLRNMRDCMAAYAFLDVRKEDSTEMIRTLIWCAEKMRVNINAREAP